MEYNDEQVLGVNDYELIAKAYSSQLKKRGFMVVHIDDQQTRELLEEIFMQLFKAKSQLFMLGGFLNTSKFYSLNERQIKKMCLLFDWSPEASSYPLPHDKTKVFLSFLSTEACLIKNLLELAEKSNYENEIRKIIDARLSLLSQILEI